MGFAISIHALLAESDRQNMAANLTAFISIHALLAESDRLTKTVIPTFAYFYPRSPCGERPKACGSTRCATYFYPRSPCGERQLAIGILALACLFLSTLSLRRATYCRRLRPDSCAISIHALLAESDQLRTVRVSSSQAISIHALLAESDAPRRVGGQQ